jgi:predicted secreted protein
MVAPTIHTYSSLNADFIITVDADTVTAIEPWTVPSSGYSWPSQTPLSEKVRIFESKYEPSEPGSIGGASRATICVVGSEPGMTDLTCTEKQNRMLARCLTGLGEKKR